MIITNFERKLKSVEQLAANQHLPEPSRRLSEKDLSKVNLTVKLSA